MDNPHGAAEFPSDSEHLAAVEAEVVACLTTFPVLRAQLKQTITQVEQSVVEVCESFHSMVARARESVTQATASLSRDGAGDSQVSGSKALITVTHGMLARTEAASELTLQTVQTMDEVEDQMRRITGSLQDVGAIARALGVLGLNANIEASRAGEHGRTFGVVANETKKLAGAAAQISKSVQESVERLRKSVDDTSKKLRTVSAALSDDSKNSRTEVDDVVSVMTATEEKLRRSVESSAHSSKALADDITRAVVAMQFQDSVSQQVTHVVEAIGEVEAGLSKLVTANMATPPTKGRPTSSDLAKNLMSRYTMQSERDAHAAQLGIQLSSMGSQSQSVELF